MVEQQMLLYRVAQIFISDINFVFNIKEHLEIKLKNKMHRDTTY